LEAQMTLEQTEQLVTWLDEEHRKDKVRIAELSDQLTQQYSQIATLHKTVMDLEERIQRVQSQALRYSQLEQVGAQTKAEVQLMLEQQSKLRLKSEEEQFQIRQLERERGDQVLSSLQMQIEALQQFQRSILGDHDLLQRLSLTLPTYQREIEEGIRRDEGFDQRIQIVEEYVSRVGQLTTEIHALSDRLRQERSEAADAGRRAEQQRARHMAEWAEQMKASRREIDEWIAQIRGSLEQHKENRKIFPELVELEERLKQTEARLLQWQRLVEETRRKERDTIVQDVDKRWQQQLGEWQFLRDEWNKRMAAVTERMTKMEDWRPEIVAQMHDFVEKVDKEHRERVVLIAELVKSLAEIERSRAANVDKAVNDLVVRFESERATATAKTKKARTSAGD
jgi:chromosome segregation ATPase